MERIRKTLAEGIVLTHLSADKFKTGLLSVQFLTPLCENSASLGALLPAVLRRGTVQYPDMRALSCALDRLYGASVSYTVRKKGETQCVGFLSSFVDDRFTPDGEPLLEKMCALLAELLFHPAMEDGVFSETYVAGERGNLIDEIRALMNDKRDYADLRLLCEMCVGEPYGTERLGGEEAASAITPQSLTAYYRELLQTAPVEILYCGSASFDRVERAVAEILYFLPAGRRKAVAPTLPHQPRGEEKRVEECMAVTQSKLSLGFSATSDDEIAMMLANLLFGGYSNSKLFLNVREKLSLCYYASSSYHRSKHLITVSSGIERGNETLAHGEILRQLAAVQEGKFEEWELEGARNCLLASIRMRDDSPTRMEEYYLGQAAVGAKETQEELLQSLSAVTRERVIAAAQSIVPDTVYLLKGEGESK